MTKMPPLPKSATDELWMRMASRYGHAWVSNFGAQPNGIAAAEWRGTLAGITPAQLREGFEADVLRADNWPPSSAKFKAMCYGIPSVASVRAEIVDYLAYRKPLNGSSSRPLMSRFARGVLARLDSYAYRNAAGKAADRIFEEAFQRTREFVMEGGTLPVDPVALIEEKTPEHKPVPPEVVAEHLAKVGKILGDGEVSE